MKMFYCTISALAVFLAGIIWGIWNFLVADYIAVEHLSATSFSVWALIFSVILSGITICGSVAITSQKNAPYAMAFPWTLGLWILVALTCVLFSATIFENRAPVVIIHACALFVVAFFAFGLLTAANVGARKDYERGRRRVFSLREDFRSLNELISAKGFSPEIIKAGGALADDFEYFQESIPASESIDVELEGRISALKAKMTSDTLPDMAEILLAITEIRSIAERRERFIKQNR